MNLKGYLGSLCTPTYIWLFLSFYFYVIYFILCVTGTYSVNNMGLTFLLTGLYIIGWTFLLDIACEYKFKTLAWILIAVAVILATVKVNYVQLIYSFMNNAYLNNDVDFSNIYDNNWNPNNWNPNNWDLNNWNSYFVPNNYVPGFPSLHDLKNIDLNKSNASPSSNSLQHPIPSPPKYGPDLRLMIDN